MRQQFVYASPELQDEGPRTIISKLHLAIGTGLFLATTAAFAPYHAGQGLAETAAGPGGPFGVAVYGAFKRMVHMQDYGPRVQLKQVMHGGATEAVGAAAGLRGEITAIDGKLLLTYGRPCPTCGAPGEDRATLLATARVKAWLPAVALPSDLKGTDLDNFIIARARAAGLDVTKPFPVRMKGTLVDVKMHVIIGPNASFKGHGSGHHMADQEDITAASIEGEVVGFYAPEAQQGTITHPGEPFHFHWVDMGRTRTTHLDAFGMAKGAQLILPRS